MQNGVMNGRTCAAFESAPACDHLEQHKAEREEIAPPVQFFATYLLGRHVESGAHLRARASQSDVAFYMCRGFSRQVTFNIRLFLGFHHLRQTKVEDLYFAADGDKDVLRLDVAMNNVFLMCRLQSTRNLDRQVHCPREP